MSDDIAGVLFITGIASRTLLTSSPSTGSLGWPTTLEPPLDTGLRATLVTRIADPNLAALTSGQRLGGALSELGTTWIKMARC
jgi:hypothetical protein